MLLYKSLDNFDSQNLTQKVKCIYIHICVCVCMYVYDYVY